MHAPVSELQIRTDKPTIIQRIPFPSAIFASEIGPLPNYIEALVVSLNHHDRTRQPQPPVGYR